MRMMHELQMCHGHNFHHRDLKFSDIVPNTITIFKHSKKEYKYLITSGTVALICTFSAIHFL